MNQKTIVYVCMVAALIVVIGLVFWFSQKDAAPTIPSDTAQSGAGLGAEIGKVSENPATKMPEINPFNKEINPLENVYKNPFE